ncbi:MAG: cytochrome c oxidase accessory protein CcoG [Saprospiraceae bacterium]|nr:cytochrome c oxidase accessory protein CcoG [Saprospiraceae bacterium]
MSKAEQDFRDHLTTVDEKGGRIWLYPKKPSGKLYRYRTYVSWILLAILFLTPYVRIDGEPLFLFNIVERKFILFSIVFAPQDMHLFALAMIILMVFIVLFTVVFGRLFCGWVCPQTIFMEMVFRKIEYLIEGDANSQKRLNKGPWDSAKIRKKLLKHAIFFLIAVLIANTFLMYILGSDQVLQIISEPVSQHAQGFVAMIIFSLVFYAVFAFFREQVCIAVCPYGRLQSVLLVKESIVVLYDWIRGEPRGNPKKASADSPMGDCIDCNLCVKVCPTGIDIRNGTQLECVNCTACIDACDEVMTKIGKPVGLIRYDSEANVEVGTKKLITPRVLGYAAVLLVLISLQSFLLVTRSDLEATILRTPGVLFQDKGDHISNLYNYHLTNKTNDAYPALRFEVDMEGAYIELVGDGGLQLAPSGLLKGSFFLNVPKETLKSRKTMLKIHVVMDGEILDSQKTSFLGPVK